MSKSVYEASIADALKGIMNRAKPFTKSDNEALQPEVNEMARNAVFETSEGMREFVTSVEIYSQRT